MDRAANPTRLARILAMLCVLHAGTMMGVSAVINSEPSANVLLIPRAEGLFIVGENRFGLMRVKSFEYLSDVETYLKDQSLQIPVLSEAHLRLRGRTGKSLDSTRITWSMSGDPRKPQTPIIEANNEQTAQHVLQWIENGNLKNSKLGFAIQLEANSAASFAP